MIIYPAMRVTQGSWEYFVVKMCIKELAKGVGFAHEVHENKVLDEMIHGESSQIKIMQDTIDCIAKSEERILNSLVIVSIGGDPKFSSVVIEGCTDSNLIGREEFNDTFGIISFNGKQKYFAIDGQEKLLAIKNLLDRKNRHSSSCSGELENEEISVIMFVYRERNEKFMERHEKLRFNLNKLAALAQVFDALLVSTEQPSTIAGAKKTHPNSI